MNSKHFRVEPEKKTKLADFDPAFTAGYKSKDDAQAKLEKDIARMAELQDVLYAARKNALLVIFQAMDTAGKDGAIKHVMSGVNPQGVQVTSFKQPSAEELEHDFLWRAVKALPGRGKIGIFNRSYYEEVLVARVHAEVLTNEGVTPGKNPEKLWRKRYEDINAFEQHLARSGTRILKFFLNLSRKEQRDRLLARINDKSKNWKFSAADLHERAYWNKYRDAYEDMVNNTSTECAPWYVVPADHKWFTRVAVAEIIVNEMESLNLSYPKLASEQKSELAKAKKILEKE